MLQGSTPSLLPPSGAADRAPDRSALGGTVRFALVGRDWSGARSLGGGVLTDELRPSRSNRMVVGRLRLTGGIFQPYVQLGLGHWRMDNQLMPGRPLLKETAAQLAAGVEVRLSARAAIGVEWAYTTFYRETAADHALPVPFLTGALAASKIVF